MSVSSVTSYLSAVSLALKVLGKSDLNEVLDDFKEDLGELTDDVKGLITTCYTNVFNKKAESETTTETTTETTEEE